MDDLHGRSVAGISPRPAAMRPLPLHLDVGSDLRGSLERLAAERGITGFVVSVVGNLSQATLRFPGRPQPALLSGELEIITLTGQIAPHGVHLHLSVSDGNGHVWGGHLEPGSLVHSAVDLLVVELVDAKGTADARTHPAPPPATRRTAHGSGPPVLEPAIAESTPEGPPRVEIAVLSGCPFSARALRMLRTLGIPHQVQQVRGDTERRLLEQRSGQRSMPQVFIDGEFIGGYDALAERHGQGDLETLRRS